MSLFRNEKTRMLSRKMYARGSKFVCLSLSTHISIQYTIGLRSEAEI